MALTYWEASVITADAEGLTLYQEVNSLILSNLPYFHQLLAFNFLLHCDPIVVALYD